jgi:hypothetical protein
MQQYTTIISTAHNQKKEIMEQGYFIPVSYIIDQTNLEGKDLSSVEFKEFVINLKYTIENMASAINTKDTSYYNTTEFLTNQTFFSGATPNVRSAFRKVVDFGTLPNAGQKKIAHGIAFDANFRLTKLRAAASNPTGLLYIPLPYTDVSGTILPGFTELSIDATDVIINTTGDGSAYTTCYVFIEYTKQP